MMNPVDSGHRVSESKPHLRSIQARHPSLAASMTANC
jgi:hypothetical protein